MEWEQGFLRGLVGALEGKVWLVLELPPSSLPGPEKSQLVSGETTVAELDGLEPDTEYTVRVWAHVAGADGPPASVVVRTGKWTLASCQPHLIGCPALLCIPDFLQLLTPLQLFSCFPTWTYPTSTRWPSAVTSWMLPHCPLQDTELLPLRSCLC